MNELKPPKKIYLQMLDEDGEEQDEITWCEDEINDTDIPYVLESALTASQEENKELKNKNDELKYYVEESHPNSVKVASEVILKLQEENKRYKDALEEISTGEHEPGLATYEKIINVARAALEVKHGN